MAVTGRASGRTTIATSAPGVGDDSDAGYRVGDRWINTSTGATYTVTDVTVGAADWAREDTSGGGGGGLSDGDYGDITVSGSGTAMSIDAGVVSLVKMADLATDRLIGRDTAGTGAPESLTVGGGVEFTGAGGIQRSALTGDVTASAGSGATTIAANVVTDTKLRDSGACSVIGRSANSSGDPADISASTNGTLLGRLANALSWQTVATWLAQLLTTKGDLVSHDGSTAVRVGVGTNDYSILADSAQTPGWRWYQRRLVQVVTTTGTYQAVSLPTDCTFVTFRTVNGGASGGAGTSGTTAAARRGGGGGGGGAEHEITYLRSQLPDSVYVMVAPASSASNGYLTWVAITDTGISTDPAVQPAAVYLLAGGGGRASAGTSAGALGSGGTATTITTTSPWCRSCVSQRTTAGGDGQASNTTGATPDRDPWDATFSTGVTQGGQGGGTNNTGAVAGSKGGGFNAAGPFGALAGGAGGTGANGGNGANGTYGGGAATATAASSDPGELSWAYPGCGGGSAVTGNGGSGGNGAPGCGGGGGGAATGTAGPRGEGGQGYAVITCFG